MNDYLLPPEIKLLTPNFEEIKNKVFEYYKNGMSVDVIVKTISKRYEH